MLGQTAIVIPEGPAKESLPGFTDSGWEFKTELFLEAWLKMIQQSLILSREIVYASPLIPNNRRGEDVILNWLCTSKPQFQLVTHDMFTDFIRSIWVQKCQGSDLLCQRCFHSQVDAPLLFLSLSVGIRFIWWLECWWTRTMGVLRNIMLD